jgi:hypothetical protein
MNKKINREERHSINASHTSLPHRTTDKETSISIFTFVAMPCEMVFFSLGKKEKVTGYEVLRIWWMLSLVFFLKRLLTVVPLCAGVQLIQALLSYTILKYDKKVSRNKNFDNRSTGIETNNVRNFLNTCHDQSIDNARSTNIFGGKNIIVTLANWRAIVKPAFITSRNIIKRATVIFRKYFR